MDGNIQFEFEFDRETIETEIKEKAKLFFVHKFGVDPTSWDEAMGEWDAIEWIKAKLKEQNDFAAREVFELVPRESVPEGETIFKSKIVYTRKMSPPTVEHPHGQVEKWRYRCTIAAFKHMVKQGIDYDSKDASTVKWNSLLILLAWACKNNQDISLIDISTFFLYGVLDKPMYMEQPEGWVDEGKPAKDWVCKVNKSMYGLPKPPGVLN